MNQPHDVVIVLKHDQKYSFHASALARNSTFFAERLIEPKAAKLNSRAKNAGVKIRWMLELKQLPNDDYPVGQLDLVELTPLGERADKGTGRILNLNGLTTPRIYGDWERVLYAFYNTDIKVADTDMTSALVDSYRLIEIAEYLGCISLIGKAVEVALMKHGQNLFRSIHTAPHAWAPVAYRLRSEIIFSEVIYHLAGSWNKWSKDLGAMKRLGEVPNGKEIAEKYHREIVAKGIALEHTLTSYYPGKLAKPSDVLPIKREDYAKDILIWIALSWYRQWLSGRLIDNKGHTAEDSGYLLYSLIRVGGEAYMGKDVLSQFHNMFPFTKKGLNLMENHLLEIKTCMSAIVTETEIMKSHCSLNVDQFPVKYLTCVQFDSKDCPWDKDLSTTNRNNNNGKRLGGNEIAKRNLEATKQHQSQGDMAGQGCDADDSTTSCNDYASNQQEPPLKRVRHD